jgi:hypothetical protein
MLISAIEVEFLLDRQDIPDTWTSAAELVRQRTAEPAERRVLVNILGTMLAMVENKLDTLGQGLDLPASAEAALGSVRRGANAIADSRTAFAAHPRGEEYFDFEVIKIASLLALDEGARTRTEMGWPEPDIWGGDLNAFPYPY